MSSGTEAGGVIAVAVALPAAAAAVSAAALVGTALGVGWVAWQGGRLAVEANRAVNREIERDKRRLAEEERRRKTTAILAHDQLVDMCSQIVAQLEDGNESGQLAGVTETEQIKLELKRVCSEILPEDVDQIEKMTSRGLLVLDKATRRKQQISQMQLSAASGGLYRGLSVADLMDDLRIAVGAMEVKATNGRNVSAADPDVLERNRLNDSLSETTARVISALETVRQLDNQYGLTLAADTWFKSCFNGVDLQIQDLYKPTISNAELKKGIRRLQGVAEQYDMMAPSLEKDIIRMSSLYSVYADAAKALGETVRSKESFKNADEIEKMLHHLEKRAKRAEECAEIYRKLGPSAYLCYAWDQELRAMGYEVHSRKTITDMVNNKPTYAKIEGQKIPFYLWKDKDLTQLYSIGSQCALQVIVHEDGTVSMQTIADSENDKEIVARQRKHCSQLSGLHQRLRENWFVLYDYEETESPEEITTVSEWKSSEDYAWKPDRDTLIMDQRTDNKEEERAKRMG